MRQRVIFRAQQRRQHREFRVRSGWGWREQRRLWLRWWHSLHHPKSHIRRADQKRIAKYLRERQKIILQRAGASWVQLVLGVFSFVLTAGILLGGWWFYEAIFIQLPEVSELVTSKQNMTTKILDRNNHLLFEIYEDENRRPIALSQVAPTMVQATIAIEDQNFYVHRGFDARAIVRAFRANQESGRLSQGASTITQQLVKQRLLSTEKTWERKIKEVILAVLVEGNFTKDEILEMYLNQVNYGGPIYGAEQAAVTFFGKNAKDLSLAESAFLAGLPQAPSRYSPFVGGADEALARRGEVLRRMREDGYINAEQEQAALAEELVFNTSKIKIAAPHFVMYVRSLLAEKYGEAVVNTGGLTVKTTLDLALQEKTQEIVTNEVDGLKNLRVSNGAAMVTRPETGEVLAMVGSRNYWDFANDGQVNVTTRLRQPGSSIKPVNYATAMESYGMTPATLILDAPITYRFKGGPDYSPKNYDGKFHGQVTLRESLASSYNIPAVKVLNEISVGAMIDQAEKMGITTWGDRSRLGLSLTLGGGEVKMAEMMEVYGTFANGGETVGLDPFLEILDYKGKTLYRNDCAYGNKCKSDRTLSAETAYQISSILSDNNARSPAFGSHSVLQIPDQEVAVKTGTTNSLRDNWTFGYTEEVVVGTWVGNNDNRPMSYVASGVTGASPMWQKIMMTQLDGENKSHFELPSGIVTMDYCGKQEYFDKDRIPPLVCKPRASVTADGETVPTPLPVPTP